MEKINVGLVGYGFSGKVFHAPILDSLEEFHLSKIVSSQAEQVKIDLPFVQVVENYQDLLNDDSLELLVIASPNSTHFELAKEGLIAGKHILVEKPFVIHSSDGKKLLDLAEQKRRCLSVYHNRRFDGDFLTIQKCLNQKKLGKINTYIAHYDRFRPQLKGGWKEEGLPGSGVLYDLGAHLIDQALQLFGLPQTVFADLGFQRESAKAFDYAHLVLNFDGIKAILHIGCIVADPGPHFQIFGDRGSFLKYGMDPQESSLIAGNRPGEAGWGEDDENTYGILTSQRDHQLVSEKIRTEKGGYQKFYFELGRAIKDGGTPPVKAEDALLVVRMIEYALQSHQEKRVVSVDVP
ncbi:MAG: oxidoreductase [SAR324 cluster bacterium]|nr:oxidoreductase [SAR324 cluster bacterium]